MMKTKYSDTPDKEPKTSHAGLEMGTLNLIVFKEKRHLRNIISKIGLDIDENEFIISNGEVVHCRSCEEKISLDKVGHILPGNHYIYCKNPICILDYLERFD